ncbi:hypothetical protein [Salinibacter sp. 10B]|nr:hypothetical protein [Salinibacter sp. 10B]
MPDTGLDDPALLYDLARSIGTALDPALNAATLGASSAPSSPEKTR